MSPAERIIHRNYQEAGRGFAFDAKPMIVKVDAFRKSCANLSNGLPGEIRDAAETFIFLSGAVRLSKDPNVKQAMEERRVELRDSLLASGFSRACAVVGIVAEFEKTYFSQSIQHNEVLTTIPAYR